MRNFGIRRGSETGRLELDRAGKGRDWRMKKRKDKAATGDSGPLAHNPFGYLGKLGKGLPQGPEPPRESGDEDSASHVARTRKGGFALSIEKRPGGKVVTVLGNVLAGAPELLRELKRHCGAGGAVRGETIELQGDHREAIERYLAGRDQA
jgi:translation initiation factor 1